MSQMLIIQIFSLIKGLCYFSCVFSDGGSQQHQVTSQTGNLQMNISSIPSTLITKIIYKVSETNICSSNRLLYNHNFGVLTIFFRALNFHIPLLQIAAVQVIYVISPRVNKCYCVHILLTHQDFLLCIWMKDRYFCTFSHFQFIRNLCVD